MQRKIKKFLYDYRNALKLAVLICVPVFAGLYFFVPRYREAPRFDQAASNNKDIIVNALNGKSGAHCTIFGEKKGEMYIENGIVKIITEQQNILYVDDLVYIWDSASTSGKLIDIGKFPLAKSFINREEIEKQIDKYKPSCEVKDVGREMLISPGNVEFKDYMPELSEIMKMK